MAQKQTTFMRTMTLGLGAAALAFGVVTPITATPAGHRSDLTFPVAVALPGVVLPAGSYTFEVANPESGASVVRVSSRDRSRVHFSGFTHRVARPRSMPKEQPVTLGEARTGGAPPITAWYPTGEAFGHLFVYR